MNQAREDRPTAGDVDSWQLFGLPGALSVASYLTAAHASQYRLIVDVLLDQQQHSLTGVPHDELAALIRDRLTVRTGSRRALARSGLLDAGSFNLEQRMRQLTEWGVTDSWEDRIRGDEDFHRHLARYQLTPLAARLHRAVRHLDEDTASAVAATLAPSVLAAQLATMVNTHGRDPAAVAEAWAVVQPTLTGMAEAAASWQAQLAGALAGSPDPYKLEVLKDTLRRYVDMWGAGVDTHSATMSEHAHQLLAANGEGWRAVALHVAGADADNARVADLTEDYLSTLRVLLAWFDGPHSQARSLRRQMRDTIAPMIRGQRTLAAVGGHVSRRAELLTLAAALEQAEDDDAAWGVWCNATGLFSARHLGTLSPQPEGSPAATSFWDAAPAPVEAKIRRQGPRSQTGRPARMADRSQGRAAARARAAAENAAQAKTRHALLSRSGHRLSTWTNVSTHELELLLAMLAALAATTPGADGTRRAVTGDGIWSLAADPASPAHPSAVIKTPHGRLVHDDVRLHIAFAETAQ